MSGIAAGPPRLLGRDIAALGRRNVPARLISPTFHRADTDLGNGQVVHQHRP